MSSSDPRSHESQPAYGAECPITVDRAVMVQRWDLLTFLHWDVDPDQVQALLPAGLTVETYADRAWVGLVPFRMEVRAARGPAVPWLSHFCETNIRTYVTAPDGTSGVWFLSLDAARLPAVVTARVGYDLPYFWSRMSLTASDPTDGPSTHAGRTFTYTCDRRWPEPTPARSHVQVSVGEPLLADELTAFDHYLTARWRLYSSRPRGGLRYALAEHDPWPLNRVDVVDLDDELFTAAGLPSPTTDPIGHWSPGVAVRIGLPRALHATR